MGTGQDWQQLSVQKSNDGKETFFDNVMRHESFEKGMVEAKRKRGRPPREWMDDIKGWTGLSVAAASSAAHN